MTAVAIHRILTIHYDTLIRYTRILNTQRYKTSECLKYNGCISDKIHCRYSEKGENGINVFLRKSSAVWYRLQNTSWHKSEGGAREGLLFLDVSWMYFVCILTSPQQRAWRCGDTWIMYGSHNTPKLVGYVLSTYWYMTKYMYQFGGYRPHFGGVSVPCPL